MRETKKKGKLFIKHNEDDGLLFYLPSFGSRFFFSLSLSPQHTFTMYIFFSSVENVAFFFPNLIFVSSSLSISSYNLFFFAAELLQLQFVERERGGKTEIN